MSERPLPLVRLGQGEYTRDYHGGEAPAGDGRDVLTATRLATLRRCPRQHWYRYELGLSRDRTEAPLRMGAAFHKALEVVNGGADYAVAIAAAAKDYASAPANVDATAWAVERETVLALLAGHFWRYENDDVRVLAMEQTFKLPLVNPKTGRASRSFVISGKIDAIVQLGDGRVAVLEYKTAGDDISPDSAYWRRLRIDPQISLYVLAARALGYDVATVLYDVTRKPSIRLRRGETPGAFGERLLQDTGERPEFYFQRREIPRLEDDLIEYQMELWQQAKQLAEMRRHGRWFRHVNRFTCGSCAFADLCFQSIKVDPARNTPPVGYRWLSNVHPELATEGDTP